MVGHHVSLRLTNPPFCVAEESGGEEEEGEASDIYRRSKYFRLLNGIKEERWPEVKALQGKPTNEHRVQTQISYVLHRATSLQDY